MSKVTKVAVICAIAAATALGGILGAITPSHAAYSGAPTNGSQLAGTVYVCVQESNEGHQYVELGHPAPDNCANGYLQYQANQPSQTVTLPAPNPVLTNSEVFSGVLSTHNTHGCSEPSGAGLVAVCVTLPTGDTIVNGSVGAVDLNATVGTPDVVTTFTNFNTGEVGLTYSAAGGIPVGTPPNVEITYSYTS